MSKMCPVTGEKVLYTECVECETKECRQINNVMPKKGNKRTK